MVNELRVSTYLFVKAHSKKGAIIPEPKMIRRPDDPAEQDKKRPLTGEDLVKALAKKGIGRVRYTPKGDEAPAAPRKRRRVGSALDVAVDSFVAELEQER